jgi:hypothetical protein
VIYNEDYEDCNEDYNETSYYESLDPDDVCLECGRPLKYYWETDEVFGRMDCYKVYYCPHCDT